MTPLLSALLYAPLSFALHVGAHEGAHIAAAAATGHQITGVGIRHGHAYMTYQRTAVNHEAFIASAPAIFDAVWAPVAMGLAAGELTDSNLRAILLVESAMSIGFLTMFMLGHRKGSDGQTFAKETRMPPVVFIGLPIGYALGMVPLIAETEWLK